MGVDPSTATGVAVVDHHKKVIAVAQLEFKKDRGFPRISKIVGGVLGYHEKYRPDFLVIEDMFIGQASSAITVVQIGSILRYFLWQEQIPFIDVPPGTLKKFATGKGNSQKDQIMMEVLRRWDFVSETNNIADAVVLGMVGLCCAGVRFEVASSSCVESLLPSISADVLRQIESAKKSFLQTTANSV